MVHMSSYTDLTVCTNIQAKWITENVVMITQVVQQLKDTSNNSAEN